MDETIITWNVTNWITVVLMVALGFFALATVSQFYHNLRASKESA